MTSPDHNYCDKCNKKSWWRYFVIIDRIPDSAGGMENTGELVDLCPDCLGHFAEWIIGDRRNFNFDFNKEVLKWIKK